MAIPNKERVGRALDQLRAGLIPYVERELKQKLGARWEDELGKRIQIRSTKGALHWDVQSLLKTMNELWRDVFERQLDKYERNLVHELIEIRNRYAHDHTFNSEDTDRTLDSIQRLLQSVGATTEAGEVGKSKEELRRTVYAEQARNKTRYQISVEGTPAANLKPWREIITPHPDVQSGRYAQAEFAADLAQVARNEGSSEYTDPVEFFRRTYITSGLKELLVGALQRLGGQGGDPVVELQTNFGGGKTHSMLALYHLFGGTPASELPGLEPVLVDAGIKKAPIARRAVLVGTDLSPGQVQKKADGTKIRTMWGELAYQLGGKQGFKLVAESDAASTSPGSEILADLFRTYSPALILIDEWVAYSRQCVGKDDIPAGNFDTQASFAQAITEAAKRAPHALVVASIPASKIEVGGEHGQHALDTLKDVFERVAKPWRPASSDEGFEIVRRRLFEPVSNPELAKLRDATIRECILLYKKHAQEFPPGTGEGAYERKMLAAYPIHPELFERLYEDWSTLDKFQRTRGVLRLLARVINRLWEGQDRSLLIMPSSIPLDDGAVRSELTRYLPDVWEPIITQDVDGPESMPAELDRTLPTLGRVSAARRVARAIYMGTAPGSDGKNPGLDDRAVRLSCVQPGEAVATFGDALRRVSDRAKYIHQDQSRYWISTKPNLNRLADDRASALLADPETLWNEVRRRIAAQHKGSQARGEFAGVHVCPETPIDVHDEPTARLVVLGPGVSHKKSDTNSAAVTEAKKFLETRGSGPRINQNCLIFLAADRAELDKLRDATAAYLAWNGIWDERDALNLDPFHQKQAKTKKDEFDSTIDIRIGGTWQWALIPHQAEPGGPVTFDERKVAGQGSLGERTSAKLAGEALIAAMGGPNLRMELDRHLWKGKNHVSYAELAEWFPRYLYLPRVVSREVVANAIQEGAARTEISDTFATAAGWDEAKGRYRGLKRFGAPTIELTTLIVRPEVAAEQETREAEIRAAGADGRPHIDSAGPHGGATHVGLTTAAGGGSATGSTPTPPRPFTTYVATARLDPTRIGRDAGKLNEEIIQHLATQTGAEVSVTLEIHITVPGGIDERTIRVVSENATALKLPSSSFERD